MNLKFKNPGFKYMIDSIMEFQKEDQSEFFREALFHFYPHIDKEKIEALNQIEKQEYINSELQSVYQDNEESIENKINAYQLHWDNNRERIEKAFEEIFDMKLHNQFNSMVGNININSICPRYLETSCFDVFYLNSEKGALGITLHEIVHFLWFKKWNEHFNDDYEEYETPHLKWVFSEMVVEAILSHESLKPLNPYAGHCVYEYFYNIEIEGIPILKILEELYQENSITYFMEKGYRLCKENESLIRSAMK